MKKALIASTVIVTFIIFASYCYSAFTANATINSQIFSTEKFFTKEQLVQEIPTALTNDNALLLNMFDSSLSELVDIESINQALATGETKILSLEQISEIREEIEDFAEVDFKVTYEDESTKEYTAILHFEYGTWKLFGTVEI